MSEPLDRVSKEVIEIGRIFSQMGSSLKHRKRFPYPSNDEVAEALGEEAPAE